MMKNIVLTGFMGTGKTEVGRELAKITGMKFIDIDAEIEKSEAMTINEIFRQRGEERFRDAETEMIEKISQQQRVIIATGGGAVLRKQNVDALRKTGTLFCLTAKPETILLRTSRTNERPLLQVEDPLERIRDLLALRIPFYENADMVIDTEDKTPLQIAEEIMDKMRTFHRD